MALLRRRLGLLATGVAVAGAVSVAVLGCSAPAPAPSAAPTSSASAAPGSYRNEQAGFALSPPRGWQQTPGVPAAAATFVLSNPDAVPGTPVLVNMTVVVTPTDADLNGNLAGAKQLLPQTFADYHPIVDEAFQLADGQPAHLLGCTFTQGGFTLRNLQLVVVARGNAYVATATASLIAFPKYESEIRESFATFTLL